MKKLRIKNLSRQIDVSERTILNWRKEGLPFEKPSAGVVLYIEDDVNNWMKENSKGAFK